MSVIKKTTVCKTQKRALARLREDVAAIEGRGVRFDDDNLKPDASRLVRLATGSTDFDELLGGGLTLSALTEIHAETARDAGALTGFVAMLLTLSTGIEGWAQKPVLWIAAPGTIPETGVLYGRGLEELGFDPARLFLVTPRRLEDALWVCEEAARTKGLGATILDMRGDSPKLNLRETQRLHMRAQSCHQPVFLMRHSAVLQASAGPQRLVIKPAASQENDILGGTPAARVLPGSIGPPGFGVLIDKNKNGPAHSAHILHWNRHERHFYTATQTRSRFANTREHQTGVRYLHAGNENRRGRSNAYSFNQLSNARH